MALAGRLAQGSQQQQQFNLKPPQRPVGDQSNEEHCPSARHSVACGYRCCCQCEQRRPTAKLEPEGKERIGVRSESCALIGESGAKRSSNCNARQHQQRQRPQDDPRRSALIMKSNNIDVSTRIAAVVKQAAATKSKSRSKSKVVVMAPKTPPPPTLSSQSQKQQRPKAQVAPATASFVKLSHDSPADCTKCQLIARWTSAQARQRVKLAPEEVESNAKRRLQENQQQQLSQAQMATSEASKSKASMTTTTKTSKTANSNKMPFANSRLDSSAKVGQHQQSYCAARFAHREASSLAKQIEEAERSERVDNDNYDDDDSDSDSDNDNDNDNELDFGLEHELHEEYEQEDKDEAEISSLTESSLAEANLSDGEENCSNDNRESRARHGNAAAGVARVKENDFEDEDDDDHDEWSLSSSCYEEFTRRRRRTKAAVTDLRLFQAKATESRQPKKQQHFVSRLASVRLRRLPASAVIAGRFLAISAGAVGAIQLGRRKRRPAPLPPSQKQTEPTKIADTCKASAMGTTKTSMATAAANGNDNRSDNSNSVAAIHSKPLAISSNSRTELNSIVIKDNSANGERSLALATMGQTRAASNQSKQTANLLSEAEVYSIEHCLKSHKSSIYVCGCMANLYLTNTRLVDNGRCSEPAGEGWQLSKTGVPVLTFDSGLTRNRDRRRLSINLTERGSGFVLWSDIIDHLSNYRAYETQIGQPASSAPVPGNSSSGASTNSNCAQIDAKRTAAGGNNRTRQNSASTTATCETFHVMYLSSNHRVMVGLSFDDATCARLFLSQVELVTSDPANISLTGPKLAQRLASVSRLGRLLTSSCSSSVSTKQPRAKTSNGQRRAKSISSLVPKVARAPVEGQQHQVAKHFWASSNCVASVVSARVECSEEAANGTDEAAERTHSMAYSARPTAAASGARNSKLSRFVAGARHSELSLGVDYTWSTLKRAIKFGQQQQRRLEATATAATVTSSTKGDSSAAVASGALRPKPLASLAMAGKVYRAGKRMPRKCDISAPCLFQHVAHVDLSGLDGLYSRSLVSSNYDGNRGEAFASTQNGREYDDDDKCENEIEIAKQRTTVGVPGTYCGSNNQHHPDQHYQQPAMSRNRLSGIDFSPTRRSANQTSAHTVTSYNDVAPNTPPRPTSETASKTKCKLSMISAGSDGGATSSSCYSSASISPASSECGTRGSAAHRAGDVAATATGASANASYHHHQNHQAEATQHLCLRATQLRIISSGGSSVAQTAAATNQRSQQVRMPPPPRVPPRSCGPSPEPASSLGTATSTSGYSTGTAAVNSAARASGDSNNIKIQAIIRELEAQTSAELVDAKRKLMADIAGQVMARAAAVAAASQAASTTSSPQTRCGPQFSGTVSRL